MPTALIVLGVWTLAFPLALVSLRDIPSLIHRLWNATAWLRRPLSSDDEVTHW